MNRRHPFENRYCNGCAITTRHEVKDTTYSCLRCGTVKYVTRILAASVKKPAV